MRRIVLLTLVSLLSGYLVTGCSEAAPELLFDSNVPSDLQELATDVWTELLDHFPARLGCIDDVTLRAAWELDDRGEYQPETATVVVRVPGTAPTLSDELVHEFAHHIEFTCPDHVELRAAFLEAQGFPSETAWFTGTGWETTPSEQWAEAAVQYVLGSRSQRQGMGIADDTVAVVRDWAEGSAAS